LGRDGAPRDIPNRSLDPAPFYGIPWDGMKAVTPVPWDPIGHPMCMENNRGPTDCRVQQILGVLDGIAEKQERIRAADILGLEFVDVI
jgi:hypothetical protein